MDVKITWSGPPPEDRFQRRLGEAGKIRELLMKHPGEWAIVRSDWPTAETHRQATQLASTFAQRLRRDFGLESVSRSLKDGDVVVYARWPEDATPTSGQDESAQPRP